MNDEPRWIHAFAAAILLLSTAVPNMPLFAQGLESERAIETIIGSDVQLEETRADDETGRIIRAIENTLANAEEVRKLFNLETVEIVFVPDLEENAAIEKTVAEHEGEIAELHKAIEGSAMFFHAVDSRDVMVRDIVALEFDQDDGVKIYAKGEAPAE